MTETRRLELEAPMEAMLARLTPGPMLERYDAMRETARVRTLDWILGGRRRLEWIHSIGVLTDDELMALVPSFPPPSFGGSRPRRTSRRSSGPAWWTRP